MEKQNKQTNLNACDESCVGQRNELEQGNSMTGLWTSPKKDLTHIERQDYEEIVARFERACAIIDAAEKRNASQAVDTLRRLKDGGVLLGKGIWAITLPDKPNIDFTTKCYSFGLRNAIEQEITACDTDLRKLSQGRQCHVLDRFLKHVNRVYPKTKTQLFDGDVMFWKKKLYDVYTTFALQEICKSQRRKKKEVIKEWKKYRPIVRRRSLDERISYERQHVIDCLWPPGPENPMPPNCRTEADIWSRNLASGKMPRYESPMQAEAFTSEQMEKLEDQDHEYLKELMENGQTMEEAEWRVWMAYECRQKKKFKDSPDGLACSKALDLTFKASASLEVSTMPPAVESDEPLEGDALGYKLATKPGSLKNVIITCMQQWFGLTGRLQRAIEIKDLSMLEATKKRCINVLDFMEKGISENTFKLCNKAHKPFKPKGGVVEASEIMLKALNVAFDQKCDEKLLQQCVNLRYSSKLMREILAMKAESSNEIAMDDKEIVVSEEKENVVFEDQRDTIEDTYENVVPERDGDPTMALTDAPWDYNKLFNRPWVVSKGTWDTTLPTLYTMYVGIVPRAIMEKVSCAVPVSYMARMHTFWRGGFEFRLQINGTKFHQGRMMMVYVPYTTEANSHTMCLQNYTNLPHVMVDASMSNTGKLRIPYQHYMSDFIMRTANNTKEETDFHWNEHQYLGHLKIFVWNALNCAPNSKQNVKWVLYANMVDAKYNVPLPYSSEEYVGFKQCANSMRPLDTASFRAEAAEIATVMALEGAARYAEGSFGNCDKPAMGTTGMPVIIRTSGNLASGEGLDYSERLSLYPKSYTMTPNAITKGGITNIYDLAKMYSRYDTTKLAVGNPQGHVVHTCPVGASLSVSGYWQTAGDKTFALEGYEVVPTMMSYVSRAFMYWRGAIKFKLQAITTQMHSGRLLISFNYYGNFKSSQAPLLECKFMRPSIVWDLQEKKEIEFEVPYNAVRPWLRCDKLYPYQILKGSTYNKDQRREVDEVGHIFVGSWQLTVLNELTNPSGVAGEVEINCNVCAGDDFELCNPVGFQEYRGSWSRYAPIGDWSDSATYAENHLDPESTGWGENPMKAQAGDDAAQATSDVTLGKPISTVARPQKSTTKATKARSDKKVESNMPEKVLDLKTVLRRYCVQASWYVVPAINNRVSLFTYPVTPMAEHTSLINNGVAENMTLLNWFGHLFTYWRGSLRYKLVFPAQEGQFVTVVYKPNDFRGRRFQYGLPSEVMMQNLNCGSVLYAGAAASSLEFEVPFFSQYNMLVTYGDSYDGTEVAGQIQIYIENNYRPTRVMLYVAAGDDFTYIGPRCAPNTSWWACGTREDKPQCHEWLREPMDYGRESNYLDCKAVALPTHYDTSWKMQARAIALDYYCIWFKFAVDATYTSISDNWNNGNLTMPDHHMIRPNGDILMRKVNTDCKVYYHLYGRYPWDIATIIKDNGKFKDPEINMVTTKRIEPYIPSPLWRPDRLCTFETEKPPDGFERWLCNNDEDYVDIPMHAQAGDHPALDFDDYQIHMEAQMGVFDATAKMEKAATSIEETSTEVRQVFPAVIAASNSLVAIAKKADLFLDGFAPGESDWLDKVAILAALRQFFRSYTWADRLGQLAILAKLFGMRGETLVSAFTHVLNQFKGTNFGAGEVKEALHAQASFLDTAWKTVDDGKEWVGVLGAGILTIASSVMFGKFPTRSENVSFADSITSGLKNMHFATMGLRGVVWLFNFVAEAISKAVEWLLGNHTPGVLTWYWLQGRAPEISGWLENIPQFEGDEGLQGMLWFPDKMTEFYQMIDCGNMFVQKMDRNIQTTKMGVFVRDGMKRLHDVKKTLNTTTMAVPSRIDPVCVALTGPPGIGKSACLNSLLNDVLDNLAYPHENRIYTRSEVDQYWSGYTQQSAVIIDDFYSVTDSPAVKEFISLKSNCSHPLNMAEITEKGKPFMSHFIFMTTNASYPQPVEIVCADALLRRRNILVEVKRRDGQTCLANAGVESLEFRLLNPMQNQYISQWMGWDALVKTVTDYSRTYLTAQRLLVSTNLQRNNVCIPESVAKTISNGSQAGDFAGNLLVQNSQGQIRPFADWRQQRVLHAQAGDDSATGMRSVNQNANGAPTPPEMLSVIVNRLHAMENRIHQMERAPVVEKTQDSRTFTSDEMWLWYKKIMTLEKITCRKAFLARIANSRDMVIDETELFKWVDIDEDDCPELRRDAPDSVALEWELLRERQDLGEIALRKRKYLELEARPQSNTLWSSRIRARFEQATTEACGLWVNFVNNHPHIITGIKILAGVAAFIAGIALFKSLAPGIYADLEARVAVWFGFTPDDCKLKKTFRKVILSDECNTAIDEEQVEEYKDRQRIGWLARLKSRLMDRFEAEEAEQIVQDVKEQSGYYSAFSRTNAKPARPPATVHAQAGDQQAVALRDVILRKAVIVLTSYADGRYSVVRGIAVGSRWVLAPWHFISKIKPGDCFWYFEPNKGKFPCFMEPGMWERLGKADAALIKLPVAFGEKRNLLNHFVPQEDLVMEKTPAELLYCGDYCPIGTVTPMTIEPEFTVFGPFESYSRSCMSYSSMVGDVRDQLGWTYCVASTTGWCGSPLIANNNRLRGRILGIHIAGDGGAVAYAVSVTRNMLEPFLNNVSDTVIMNAQERVDPALPMKVKPAGNFTIIGAVPNNKAVSLPRKTDIKPSVIFEMIAPHETEPSVLTANDPRNLSEVSPLHKAVNKYGKQPEPFPPHWLDHVLQDTMSEVDQWQGTMPKRLLTLKEVILGNDRIEFLDRMNIHTSPGYPYVLSRTGKGKEQYFDLELGEILDPELAVTYAEREQQAKSEERVASIWMDCLKDERRPIEKIQAGKTRLFTIPPVDFTMLMRKYFMAFVTTFYQYHCKMFSAVGVNPMSLDWTNIYMRLARKSDSVVAGDFGTFDGNIHPQLIMMFAEMVNFWYDDGEQNARVRRVLCDEIAHTYQLCLNTLYQTHQGNPSGNPITVVLNTFVNVWYMRLAWIGIMKTQKPDFMLLHNYRKHVAEIAYGDDNIIAITPSILDIFNQRLITCFLKEFGVEYTDESKSDTVYTSRPLDEVTFLKTKFGKHPANFLRVPQMKKQTILELTNWIRKSEDDVEQTIENCRDALRYAYGWGRDYFDDLKAKINKALVSVGQYPIYDSWTMHDEAFKAECGFS